MTPSVAQSVEGGIARLTDFVPPDELSDFVKQIDAALRALARTRLRVSIVAATAPSVSAVQMASAVRHALGIQEPMIASAGGDGVVFLYLGPRGNADRDDARVARDIDRGLADALSRAGRGDAALHTVCVHRWADELTGAEDLVLALCA